MDSATELHREVLSRVAEDYEAAHTITADIARDFRRPVSEAEVRVALLELARAGSVQAYVYETSTQQYREVSPAEAEAAKVAWFMAIDRGTP